MSLRRATAVAMVAATACVWGLITDITASHSRFAVDTSTASALAAPEDPLQAVTESAAQLPRLQSLLVSSQGRLVLERYYHGSSAGRLANVKSVSKSIISALVGVALARGAIPGVDSTRPF